MTDSTAYLPRDLAERLGIRIVSLYYDFGDGDRRRETDDTDFGTFYGRLERATTLPTTSPPTVEDFVAEYEPALASGSVLSIHISSGLSETCSIARRAAERLAAAGSGGERVRVLDSTSTGGTLALLVLTAARAAAAGADADAVAERVREARVEARTWFLLDTLEYLKRGGRVGTATAWIGSTLNVKPILSLESETKTVERVRTRARGIERLIEIGRRMHAGGVDGWSVQHTAARGEAEALVERLQAVFGRPPAMVTEVGPVIGTHAGPGLLGFGCVPARHLG